MEVQESWQFFKWTAQMKVRTSSTRSRRSTTCSALRRRHFFRRSFGADSSKISFRSFYSSRHSIRWVAFREVLSGQFSVCIVDPGVEHEPIVKWFCFKSHRTIRFRTLKSHTHATHCIDRYNFKLEICTKMHEISSNYIDRHNFKLEICIKIW